MNRNGCFELDELVLHIKLRKYKYTINLNTKAVWCLCKNTNNKWIKLTKTSKEENIYAYAAKQGSESGLAAIESGKVSKLRKHTHTHG